MSMPDKSQKANEGMPEPFPHCPAAFINVIAESGTKRETIQFLQETWNELCWWKTHAESQQAERTRNEALEEAAKVADMHAGDCLYVGAPEKAMTAVAIADMIRALKRADGAGGERI